ncbi:hypothetical protein [Sulfuritalea hydrogenivorans]|nr:hypothetical protein [Sulfuritalea hydrogenivorans]
MPAIGATTRVLADRAPAVVGARPRGVKLGGERGTLGGDILAGVLRQEALVHQRLLAFGELLLLPRQRLDAPRFGFVGLVLKGDIAGIDHRQQIAGLDLRAGTDQDLRHATGDFGADLRIGQHFQGAQGFQRDLELALGRLCHGDQRRRRHGLFLFGFLTAGSKEDQCQAGNEGVTHQGRTDSSAKSSAISSRRRIRWTLPPSTMTSAARGRVL